MSSENDASDATALVEKTSKENVISNNIALGGEGHGAVNGVANGYGDKHSSSKEHRSDKEKHREKDKTRDKSRDEKRDKEKRDKHSSGSSKDKERSSHSSSSKDKDRKHREEKKDREHKSSSSKDKEHKSSSSSSHKDKEKHSTHSKDKSSSSTKEKHGSSSSSRDKEKEKSKLSSSSDKKPSSSSSSSKDKHRSKDGKDSKEKSKSSSSKDEDRHREKKEKVEEKSVPKVKLEPEDVKIKLEFDSIAPPVKQEAYESEEEIPLAQRSIVKRELEEDSEDDVPLSARKKAKKTSKKRNLSESEDSEDEIKPAKKAKKAAKKTTKPTKPEDSPTKKKKKEEEPEVWKWWEEEKKEDGVKWKFLEHLGPLFAPAYVPLPPDVKFSYDGKEMKLTPATEEVATFYAKMIDHDYTSKEVFNKNFFQDWRGVMNDREREKIKDLKKCNFKQIAAYFLAQTEARKAMTKEEKKVIKEKNEEIQKEYGFCMIDGHKEKIGNFRIEPPGLFRGRGEHPKMGKLKKRVVPEQVIINCSKNSKYPKAPEGHKWKEVRHDNAVTWLASWSENVQGQVKYVMLNPSSKLKGEKDWQKYEVARELKKCIGKIRNTYQDDWKAKEMMIRQRAVALYFIDKLALRAGNEKDEDQADTVGCCSLRYEHITLQEELGGKKNVVVFDFLGKDSIRYYNEVSVEKRVFKNLQLFMQNKDPGDDLFDRLNTGIMNKHLGELMPGLSAKVFRTYNASITLQNQLEELTEADMTVQEKILAYNRANRAVAILCNHQRAVPKTHEKSMGNMKEKILAKEEAVRDAEKAYKLAKKERGDSARNKIEVEKRKKAMERLQEQLDKLNLQATDKEENKDIALGTSKLNYLDPRISVAWCKKFGVPIEKVYNKTQRSKFNWAIDMATKSFVF